MIQKCKFIKKWVSNAPDMVFVDRYDVSFRPKTGYWLLFDWEGNVVGRTEYGRFTVTRGHEGNVPNSLDLASIPVYNVHWSNVSEALHVLVPRVGLFTLNRASCEYGMFLTTPWAERTPEQWRDLDREYRRRDRENAHVRREMLHEVQEN